MMMTGIKSSKFLQSKISIHSNMKPKEFCLQEERILEYGIINKINFSKK